MATVNDTGIKIHRADDSERLAHAALEIFVQSAREAIEEKGAFFVAISGGHTPVRFFELLGLEEASLSLPWEKVQLFWVDERCVPPEAEASNYGLAAHTFLDKVGIPAENVHRMSGECADYQVAVSEYRNTLRRVFRLRPGETPQFDLIVLGMGEDGHIGSLYPNSFALFDTEDLVAIVYQTEGDYSRITLTHPVMCAGRRLIILVSGSEKAQILKEVLTNEPDPVKYPVHTLWPILHKVTWLIDREAGGMLETTGE
ncbi:MAG TPA: 6-phosphogluconolactonase [Anaerohalosphaeraceae bacterium]|jgi:6-phosphogluconolactonase|nr:6-phosphogluconolactonase [Anaerohalosphaeraceae bacterium]HRT52149.1 6-phosphogluconolactonase [Anaerohalosphaeraceae bacterium]HRT86630.1 6-phosphogluconolactonase [Anaerohalosphaeraceae bacterium]